MRFLEIVIYKVILKTCIYIEETGRRNSLERFPFLRMLTERLNEEALEREAGDGTAQTLCYRRLIAELLEGDKVLITALDLILAAMHVPEFGAYLNYFTGNHVTLQLAFELEGVFYPDFEAVFGRLKQLEKICRVAKKNMQLSFWELEGDNALYAYLTGADKPPLSAGVEYFGWDDELHEMFIRGELAREGARCLQTNGIWQISGAGGRIFLAKHTAKLLKKNMLVAKLSNKMEFSKKGISDFFTELARGAFLWDTVVCISGITEDLPGEWKAADFLGVAADPFLKAHIPLILCTDGGVEFSGEEKVYILHSRLEETTREEREAVFCGFGRLYGLNLDCVHYSVRFPLTASEIARAVNVWRKEGGGRLEETCFSRICCDILRQGRTDIYGEVLYPTVGFSDLKLPDDMREVLGQICTGVDKGHTVFEKWNLKHQYPYGRAVTVLLAGAPGTGKTMTAHVLAKELEIPLYQVDLSAVMDKYIGETEKHLERVFAFAQKTNTLLFFDEADSLFGKRGEVTEGRDRYANMEVSYILQRIERFEGVVVLATNFYGNIDKAFLRRMKYVLKYQMPDAAVRRGIWESCLPKEIPADNLDVDYLAGQFDFTGGMIKNVVLNACVTALYERKPLDMRHVLRAVSAEYEKMEQSVSADIWGEYGYLMDF